MILDSVWNKQSFTWASRPRVTGRTVTCVWSNTHSWILTDRITQRWKQQREKHTDSVYESVCVYMNRVCMRWRLGLTLAFCWLIFTQLKPWVTAAGKSPCLIHTHLLTPSIKTQTLIHICREKTHNSDTFKSVTHNCMCAVRLKCALPTQDLWSELNSHPALQLHWTWPSEPSEQIWSHPPFLRAHEVTSDKDKTHTQH